MELYWKLLALGLVGGAVTAWTGIGWGVITMPALLLFFVVPPKEAVTLSVLASLGYLFSIALHRTLSSEIPLGSVAALGIGSFLGGLLGAFAVGLVPDWLVRWAIGAMAIVAGGAILLGR